MHNIYSSIKIDGIIYPRVKEIYISISDCYIVYTATVSGSIYKDVKLHFSSSTPVEIILNERK